MFTNIPGVVTHSVSAIIASSYDKAADKINQGHYKCDAHNCLFEGPLDKAIAHTVQNQPTIAEEA